MYKSVTMLQEFFGMMNNMDRMLGVESGDILVTVSMKIEVIRKQFLVLPVPDADQSNYS